MLELKSVDFSESNEEIFKNLDFFISENSMVGLFGKSGSGKTTFARILTKVKKPQKGKVSFLNEDIQNIPFRRFSRLIQMVFQDPGASLNPMQKCKDLLLEPSIFHKIETDLEQLLQSVGLDNEILDKYPFELSGGQKQKIAIARALSIKPKLLICDEAIASLDIASKYTILNTLKKHQKQTCASILFITHENQFVRPFCDKIYRICDLTIERVDQIP